MSLASAYRKLRKKSRENLGTAAKGRNLSSLIEQGGDRFGQVFGFADEAFDITDGDFYMPSFTSTGGGGEGWFCNFGSPAYSITSGNADGNGYGNFEYSVPSGFLSLCSKNLGENS